MNGIKLDTSGWDLKSARVRKALEDAASKAVDFGMDEVNKAAAKNLSGPSYGVGGRGPMTGQMPIPRQTANLAGSLDSKRPKDTLGIVYSRADKASYNVHVHYGTRYVKPRRFLGDAVQEKKQAVLKKMKELTIKAIREAGQ